MLLKEVYNGKTNKGQLITRQVNAQNWTNGVYLVQYIENGKIITAKLLISH
jgi:hypothetical protein